MTAKGRCIIETENIIQRLAKTTCYKTKKTLLNESPSLVVRKKFVA